MIEVTRLALSAKHQLHGVLVEAGERLVRQGLLLEGDQDE